MNTLDPARGVARQTLVRLGRECIRNHSGAECDEEIIGMLREAACRVTGGNCAFADDDLNILAHLAERAVEAGLTDKLHPQVARRAAQGMSARQGENSRSEVEGEARQPDPKDAPQ